MTDKAFLILANEAPEICQRLTKALDDILDIIERAKAAMLAAEGKV